MKIIVGLGNPGKEYENTRHNLGYMVLDKLAESLNIKVNKERLYGLIGDKKIEGEKVLLVKPLTYMNLSGNCVERVLKYYKATPNDLVIIYDDIDIAVGKIRVKPNGNPGTHNGMKDITQKLGTKEFARVRIGSGKPRENQDLAEYVLSNISKEEKELIDKSIENGAKAVLEIINNDIESAMNHYNSK